MLYAQCPPGMPRTPDENPVMWRNPGEQNMKYEDVSIKTADGCSLHAWLIKQENVKGTYTVIYFHGNAGNVGFRLPLLKEMYSRSNVNILAVDYRGYGFSTGSPSEKGLLRRRKAGSCLREASTTSVVTWSTSRCVTPLSRTACAIVPLKPNELKPHAGCIDVMRACTGSAKRDEAHPRRSTTSGLSCRSCALPAPAAPSTTRRTRSNPTCPEGDSL